MQYVLDTNILLFYIRDAEKREFIEAEYAPFNQPNQEPVISIVMVAEIMTLADINNWGRQKRLLIQDLLDRLVIVEVKYEDMIQNYIELERFNRGQHSTKAREGSHIKMGKNDLWIAATTMSIGATLMTSDKDFSHLDGMFFDIAWV